MSRDLTTLQDRLVRILPDGDRITGLRAFATGHSNETYLIEGLDQILRLPPSVAPLMPDSHGVAVQARIYAALGETAGAPQVPRILFQSDDDAVVGDPFFVMARVAGEEVNDYQPQSWFANAPAAVRDAMCATWMTTFCGLASLTPLAVLGEPVTPEDEARRWRAMALAADCSHLVELFDRLLATPAPRTGAPSLVHGDPKLANLMWADRELTAVLDWELAYNGEPLADLGYILSFFASDAHPANRACGYPDMWLRDRIIAHWADCTGRLTDGLIWHEAAAIGKMAAIIAYGHNLYISGKSDDARFLRWKERVDINREIMDFMLRQM